MEMTPEKSEQIYKDYHDKVLHFIYGKTSNYTLAEDLTSDVFLKVYSKLDTFDDTKASISTWIYRIAQNTLIDYFRTRKVYSEVPEDISEESEIDDELLANETLDALADALTELPERDRDLIILHYYHNLTLKEAAARLGMSYSNAKLVHNKSLVVLERLMSEYL